MSPERHAAQVQVRWVQGQGQQLSKHLPAWRERRRGKCARRCRWQSPLVTPCFLTSARQMGMTSPALQSQLSLQLGNETTLG